MGQGRVFAGEFPIGVRVWRRVGATATGRSVDESCRLAGGFVFEVTLTGVAIMACVRKFLVVSRLCSVLLRRARLDSV